LDVISAFVGYILKVNLRSSFFTSIANGISLGSIFQSSGIANDNFPEAFALCAFTFTVISLGWVELKIITFGSIVEVNSGKIVKGT